MSRSVDAVVLKYLQRKGYRRAEDALRQDAKVKTLDEIEEAELNTSVAHHVLLGRSIDSEPHQYVEGYTKLREWVFNSLDLYKEELSRILFPLLVHCVLDLAARDQGSMGKELLQRYKVEHARTNSADIIALEAITLPQHVQDSPVAQRYRANKMSLTFSEYSWELLTGFLHSSSSLLMLSLINEHFNIEIVPGGPADPNSGVDGKESLKGTSGKKDTTARESDAEGSAALAVGMPERAVLSLNERKVHWGLLNKSAEAKFVEERIKQETARLMGGGAVDGSDPSASQAQKKPKKGTQMKESKAREIATALVMAELGSDMVKAPRVEKCTLPLSVADEEEQVKKLNELRSRVSYNSSTGNSLPSVCFYTVCNSYGGLNCVHSSCDGAYIACGFADASLKVWNLDTEGQTGSAGLQVLGRDGDEDGDKGAGGERGGERGSERGATTSRVAADRDGLGGSGGKGFNAPYSLRGHSAPVFGVHLSPSADRLLSSSSDCSVRLWSMELKENVMCYKGHNFPVWDVKSSPVGHSFFATASHDRTARIWTLERPAPVRIMAGHLSDVDCVAWHPNCNYIATGSSDKTVRFWDVQTGECVRLFTGHRGTIYSLAMAPDGRGMASAGDDGSVMLWDLGTGKRVSTLTGHVSSVWCLAYSSDGQVLASGGGDNSLRLWRPQLASSTTDGVGVAQPPPQPAMLKTLYTKNTPVYHVEFSRRNLLLASGPYTRG